MTKPTPENAPVGAKVRRIASSRSLVRDEVYTINQWVGDNAFYVEGYENFYSSLYFELAISAEDEAKKVLEALGYTVTPPKPKETGEVIVYRYLPNGKYYSYDTETWEKYKNNTNRVVIARVKWTEGDGLTSTEGTN